MLKDAAPTQYANPATWYHWRVSKLARRDERQLHSQEIEVSESHRFGNWSGAMRLEVGGGGGGGGGETGVLNLPLPVHFILSSCPFL